MNDRLLHLVERVRDYEMSPEEVAEQRISFAFGNAPGTDRSTRDDVRKDLTAAPR